MDADLVAGEELAGDAEGVLVEAEVDGVGGPGVDDLVEGDARLRAGLPDAAGRVAGAALAGPYLALAVYEGLKAAAQLVEPVGRDALADDEIAVV